MKDAKRAKTLWTYNLNSHMLTGLYPNDSKLVLDLTVLVKGLSQQQELVYQYGVKQWLASNYAACKTSKEKIASAEADFEDLLTKGITLLGEGKIGIIGRERANAAPRTQDKLVLEKLATMTVEDCLSAVNMEKLGFMKFSNELLTEIKRKAGLLEEEVDETEEVAEV